MNLTAAVDKTLWRVGYHLDPIAFTPRDLYAYNHRFDDAERRFRTLYLAEQPETALREVLADFRPNLAARQRHLERFGPDAAADFAPESVTAAWRRQHVLVAGHLELDGPLVDLMNVTVRQEIERRHVALLVAHGLEHLDMHEVTTRRRAVTQKIAADLYDGGAAAVRFPSRLDGLGCVALFEGRGRVHAAGEPVVLTDPPPRPLAAVSTAWRLKLESAPTT